MLVVEPSGLFSIEIKADQGFQSDFLTGLRRFLDYAGDADQESGIEVR